MRDAEAVRLPCGPAGESVRSTPGGILVAGALTLGYLAGLVFARGDVSPLAVAASLLLGVLVADLITALVHWACDTWGSEQTPLLGAGLIKGFREHHVDPRGMLRHDWIEVNGTPALAASAGFLVLSPLAWQLASAGQVFWYAALWSLIWVAGTANQTHKWAHAESPPALVRGLQRLGVILSPRAHAQHHRGAHTHHYCISTGWLNGMLDRVRFWRGLERLVEVVTGARARSGTEKT